MMPRGPRISPAEQLARHTAIRSSGCVEWTGRLDDNGYGAVYIHRAQKKAHRVSWELSNGPIPPGMLVLHSCDNPACVNPAHLFLGSNKDNTLDMMLKGRGPIGERAGASKLTLLDVQEIRRFPSTTSHATIARKFQVSRQQIGRIRNGANWNHSTLTLTPNA